MNEIQEKIAKLYEGGYSSNDIYDVLVYSGLSSDEVANSMAAFYDERSKQEQEAMQKKREELDEKYGVLAGQGYGLKKKDSDGEDLPLESSGGYPETQADPLSWSVRNNDEKLLEANSSLNHINSMLASIGGYSTYGTQSFQNDESINKAYQDFIDAGFRIQGYDDDYIFDVEDSEDIRQKLIELKKAKRSELAGYVEQMNVLNKSMGVETNYSVDERNPSSFAEAQKMALMRMRRDEELLRQAVPEYANEDWDRYQEDMDEARAEAMSSNGLGYALRGLSNVYMNANLSFQQTKANWWGDDEAVAQLRYHQDMMGNKRQMEKAEFKKKAYSSEERANMNYSEVFTNVMSKALRGQMTVDDFSDLVLGTAVEVPDVASQFVYWGGQAMAGPAGWASIAAQVASMRNADLIADRPDLSSFERGALAITSGIVEGAANAIFSGAEKALSQGIRSIGVRGQIENVKRAFLNSGKSKFIKDFSKGYISEGFEEAFVELMDYSTLAAVDIASGRRPEDKNPYELLDAFMLGGMGGGIGPTVQHAVSNIGHNKTFAQKMGILGAIREYESAYNNAEFGSAEKIRLRKQLAALRSQYKYLTGMEGKAYEDFSPEDRRRLQKVNQELSYLRDMIRAKRDGNGIKLNKDQVNELKKRFDEGWAEKTRIEEKYESPETATANKSTEEPVEVDDVNETPAVAVERTVDPKELEEAKQAAPVSDSESDAVDKQGKQLSLFDETKQKEEAPAEEAPVEEAPVEEAPAEEAPAEEGGQTSEQILEGATDLSDGLDLSDREKVGDEDGQFSIDTASALNRALKGYKLLLEKAGTKVVGLSRAAFDRLVEVRNPELFKEITDKEGRFLGFYDVQNNRIILPSDTKAADIQEEFAHAMFLPIINGKANPEVQKRLYDELMALRESMSGKAKQRFEAWFNDRLSNYSSFSETKRREEMILGFFRHYKDNSSDFKGLGGKIRSIINTAFKLAGQKGSIVLKNDSDLMELAEAYSRMSEGEVGDIEIAKDQFQEAQERAKAKPVKADETKRRPDESDEEYSKRLEDIATRMTEMATPEQVERAEQDQLDQAEEEAPGIDDLFSIEGRKKFTYLKDAEVFFTHHPYASSEKPAITSSTYTSPRTQKSVKVKDYFHFRNWYNKMTGNQTAPRVTDMFYIDKNGVARNINTPKPKVDKDGKKVFMKVPPTPTELMMRKERTVSEEQLELRKEASRISKEAGEIWNRIPWSTGTNFNDFGPDIEGQVGSLSNEARLEYLQIQKLNLIQAERLGLSKEQGQEILKNPDTARDILQPSGKQMSDGEGRAPSGYDGDMAFAIESKPKLTPMHTVLSTNPNVINRLTGVVEDIVGKRFPVGHFDQTMVNPELGVDTGASSLNGYTITEGGKTYHVVTSVINQSTARQLEKFYKEEAERDYKNALKEGRAKKGQPYRGKLVYGLSALQDQSTFGNPSVFYRVFSHLYNTIAGSDNSLQRANNFFKAIPGVARSNMRLLLLNSKQARLPDGTVITKSISLSRKLSEANGDITKVKFDSIEEFKEAMYLIADPDNQNNVFGTTDVEKNTERSFEARKLYFNKEIMAEYMNSITTGIDWKAYTVDQLNSQMYMHFNDPIYIGSPQGGLNGYRTFEYTVDENGNMSTPFVHYDSNRGFEGVLVSEFPVSDVKFFKEIYKMEEIDPNMSVVLGTRQRFRTTKQGKRKGYKEEVRGPISELKEYEKKKGKAARRQKVLQLGRKQKVILGQGEGGLDSFSIESKLTKQETDLGTFEMRNLTGFQKFRNLWIRRLVDRYNDIFDIQAAIKNKIGKIDSSMDFQMKEELMYGKAAEALKRLDEKVNSIRETMKEEGVSLEEISDYLYALHVEERNRIIKERTEEENEKRAKSKKKLLPINEAGSGKTNEWAQETLDQFSDAKKKSLEKVANQIREIQQDTRETMVEFGLESQETVDAWNDMFENYVPLAGIAMDEESSATTSYPSGGAGLSVFGPTTKRAKGRKTAAENIIAQVIAQNAAIHIKARTNEAIRSLYDLAEANPNPKVWEVLDEANSLDPHVVSVRVDGEQKFIRFKDPSHAETLRNMNLPQTSLFVKILRAPSNWLRKAFTTLSPEFVVSNFTRDIQTAVFNAAAEAEIEGGILNGEKVMGDILKTVPKALKALIRGQFGASMDQELERYYEDFKEDGAKTGWAYTKSLEDLAAELEKGSEEESRMQKVLGVGKNMVDFVEGMNEAFEDATRLAAYIAARRNGVSREKAAQLAKNITVNFNKHGEWGQALNGVYLFFNASVQGTSRMFRTIAKLKPVTRPDGTTREWYERATTAQKMAAGLTLFSSMVAVLNAGMSDEDEDGVLFYDKIPDYVKERNLIIMNPRDGKNYYKIPLPYGYNIFSNVGTVSADVARGGMDGDEGIYFMANSLLNAFSPVSFGQSESLGRSIAKGAIPTAAKPFFDAWGFNETYFGGPVAAEQLPFGVKRPESSMSFRSPEAVQDWFAWLNEATGGSDRKSGKVDINPDRMWYVLEYFVGSAGNFVGRTGKTIKSIAGKVKDSEYPVSVNDIPFVRVMYGEQARYYDHGKYRDNETEVKQLYLERKDTKDYKNPRYNGIVKLNNKLKLTEKKLKKLRNERREARKIKDWTRRSIIVQRIMDEERKVIMEFNKMYDELRK